jgi:hypothetical protein
MTGDSRVYWGDKLLCGCRDSSPHVRSVPYFFGIGGNLSDFNAGVFVKKISGFLPHLPHGSVRLNTQYLGKTFLVKSVSFDTFTCAHCGSRCTGRDILTYTLIGSDQRELVLSESGLNQSPHCRGWVRTNLDDFVKN